MTLRQLKLNAPDGTARAREKRDPVARALTQDDSRMVLAPPAESARCVLRGSRALLCGQDQAAKEDISHSASSHMVLDAGNAIRLSILDIDKRKDEAAGTAG